MKFRSRVRVRRATAKRVLDGERGADHPLGVRVVLASQTEDGVELALQLGQIGLRNGDARQMRDAFDGGEIDRHGGLRNGGRRAPDQGSPRYSRWRRLSKGQVPRRHGRA